MDLYADNRVINGRTRLMSRLDVKIGDFIHFQNLLIVTGNRFSKIKNILQQLELDIGITSQYSLMAKVGFRRQDIKYDDQFIFFMC